MAENRDEFIDDVIAAHDELIDVAEELEALLIGVPELGLEPVVIGTVTGRVSNILDKIDEAHADLFDLKEYIQNFDAETGDLGTDSTPAGNVNEQFAPGTEDVAQPEASDSNLIRKPDVDTDHVADDETRDVLVDKEDAADSIPGPTSDGEGGVAEKEERFEPEQYPSTDQAGDISVTQKPESEPDRPDADAGENAAKHGEATGQIDVTAPNDAGVQSPDPDVSISDEGSLKNDKVPQQQGDAPETDSK